jgi:hypothetical protein
VQFLVEASLYESPEESAKRVDVLVKLDQVACLPLVPQPLLVTTASFCEFFFLQEDMDTCDGSEQTTNAKSARKPLFPLAFMGCCL